MLTNHPHIPANKMSNPHLFLLFFFLHIYLSFSLDCNAADRKALLNIKSELGNPPELSAWLPATNCCTWSNVYCTDTGRIYNIYLISLNVSTTIPPSLGNLPELETIQLQAMPGLYGTIPPSFSKLAKLQLLLLTNTSVSGVIPDFLSRTNLSALDLSYNKFSGPIPLSLSKLPNLRFLDLSGNSLSGRIPPGLLHGTFRFLYLDRNKLSGDIPQDYGNGDLDTIDLSHNRLTGDPSFLFGITKPTTKIDLSWNQLEFDLTRVVFPHYLEYLDLSHNRIKGKVSKSLQDVKLRFLNLSYNELCGEIPNRRFMVNYQADSYIHNKCLCGTPLPPCKS
ncbi:Polygalacturonase inhibitor 1 [Rhynchospora pubera]|uniref:Polygalacturonase inhibitor 1 n=1 Tax=Rhynchospora pubera TaxID=906938 RepID=A0AAV8HIB3_9POAL|nr:Polygalacturonase inhibitor 1 [Rhynchospora pubera]